MARLYIRTISLLAAFSLMPSCFFGCTTRPKEDPPQNTSTAQVEVIPPEPVTTEVPESHSPAPTPTPSPDPTPTPTPAPQYPDVPEQPAAEAEFFSDAAFLGNSLVDGFRLFSGLTTCDYYCATSMTVTGAGNLIQQMGAKQYGKVYILLGINEIGYDVDYFKGLYAKMLDTIIAQQPDADIYVMSLTPVSAAKDASSDTFNMKRVKMYNEALYELAKEKECYYLDICSALAGSDGFLPSNVTTDGVHFAADHYKVWLNYVSTHYVS